MASTDRRLHLALVGVAALVLLAAVAAPAWSQTSEPRNGADPRPTVNTEDFEDRARQWSEARRRAREEALRRAEELANQARTTTTTTTTAATTTTTTTAATTTTTTTAATTTTTTTEPPTTTTEDGEIKLPIPAGTTEAQWHALRQCESTQNYRAISSSGRYRGAYQFSIRTWNWVAEMHYPDLVGVDPIDASPPDQDKMAYKLYEINGWDPWPTCKKRLPS
jgi:hypothetical protein